MSIEVCNLRKYLYQCEEELLVAVRNEELLGEGKEKQFQQHHMKRYIGKSLYGNFHQNTPPGRDDTTWNWLKKRALKKEAEGMLMEAQELALTRFH